MDNIKICSVVKGGNLKEFLKNLDRVQEVSEMVELRIDLIKGITEKDLEIVKDKTKKTAILTCRKKEIFFKALELGFDFIDVDLEMLERDPAFAKAMAGKVKKKFIISYHDFKKTPAQKFLHELVLKIKKHHPDIIKIATMVTKDDDNLNLFRLILDKSFTEDKIIIGMGEKGQITRILGPILGNYLTYASVDNMKTALGQINYFKLKEIYKLL